MENENIELNTHSSGNKDLWLFLIVLDVVFLCILGFFLYRYFSSHLFSTNKDNVVVPAETTISEPIDTPVSVANEPETAVVEIAPAPVKEEVVEPTPTVGTQEPQIVNVVAQIPQDEPVVSNKKEEVLSKDKQQSVFVSVNPKSKYRRVTFRWYGEGKTVSIVSGFTMSKPQALKKQANYWETTLSILPGTYKFLYIIDGVNTIDPNVDAKDGRSIITIE